MQWPGKGYSFPWLSFSLDFYELGSHSPSQAGLEHIMQAKLVSHLSLLSAGVIDLSHPQPLLGFERWGNLKTFLKHPNVIAAQKINLMGVGGW